MVFGKIVSLILSSFSNPHQADEDLSTKVERLERKIEELSVKTTNDTCGANTALARPILDYCSGCPCTNWFATISPLYWHAKVGGTNFAYTSARSPVSMPVVGRVKQVDFNWDWGIKAGLGYQFWHGGWDLYAQITSFSTHGSEHSRSGSRDIIIPLKGSEHITQTSGDFVFCKTVKAQFELHYRKAEIELGRHFFVEEFLSVRPHIGLSGYYLYMDQITRYYGGQAFGNFLGIGKNAVHIRDVSGFGGLGPEIGMDTNWHLGKCWSFLGNISSAIFYGRFVVHHAEKFSLAFPKNVIHLKDTFHGFSPAARFTLGLQYDTYFNHDRNHFRMKFCYDVDYLWRANQMQNVNFTIPSSPLAKFEPISADVGFHGFEFNLRFDF